MSSCLPLRSPHPVHIHESHSQKRGKRVNPSPTFTPKVCSTIGYHNRKPVELGRTEVPMQTRLTTSFESQLLAFFSQIPSLSRTEGEITQQNVIPRFSFPKGPAPPDLQSGKVTGETRTPSRERRHPKRSKLAKPDSRAARHGRKQSPKSCPNPKHCPGQPPRTLRPLKLWPLDSQVIPARNG